MKFHEYYHNIFLGEDKNWYLNFNIKEKENKYQLDYFVNDNNSNKENDIKYRNTIFKLAYNYEKFGDINHRATFICPMHKASALINVYYWNMY